MSNFFLLQIASAGAGSVHQYFLMGSVMLVFYFFMIRPQRRRQRDQRAFLENLKKGTAVVTIGGIHGKIYETADDKVILEVDGKGAKITVSKSAISIDSTQKYTPKK